MKLINYVKNTLVLLILFFIALFLSNTINMNQTANILKAYNTTPLQSGEYQTFLIHYYQTQSEWINKWFTLLGILIAISGIAVPLLLNASYKEKMRELQKEAQKYKKLTIEQEIRIEKLIKNFTHEYNEKLEEFEENMRFAVEKAETDSILNKLKALEEEAKRWRNKSNSKQEIETYNEIISLGTKAITNFKHNNNFCLKLYYILEQSHYLRGLNLRHHTETLSKAITDFKQCSMYNNKMNNPDSPALKSCLLECYIFQKDYTNAIKIANTISEIPREKLDGTHFSKSHNFFEILSNEKNSKAKELLEILEEIAKD